MPAASRVISPTTASTRQLGRIPSREMPDGVLPWHLIVLVLLPFAGGFYLSYLYRTVNALLADRLIADIGMDAAELGLLTSVYLLVTAAVQLPFGVLIDRHGPRRVQSALLVVAAVGALLFAVSDGFWGLLAGRALIGLGVATALMAGIKAAVMWVPKERLALANGILVMVGALGAVTATLPAELFVDRFGWRVLFIALAAMTFASALAIWLLVPEHREQSSIAKRSRRPRLDAVVRDPRFWRLAPLAGLVIGTSWSLQGLWAARWLADVDGLDRPDVIASLLMMALALSVGALGLGWGADHLKSRGWPLEHVFTLTAATSIAAQLALVAGLPLPSMLLWAMIAAVGAATVLSYTILATFVARDTIGRANAALNLFHFGGAFAVQWAFGLMLAFWPTTAGHYPAEAYKSALTAAIVLQSAALLYFVAVPRRERTVVYAASRLHSGARVPLPALQFGAAYVEARLVWRTYLRSARTQVTCWRVAAIGSLAACGLLMIAVASAALYQPESIHAIDVEQVGRHLLQQSVAARGSGTTGARPRAPPAQHRASVKFLSPISGAAWNPTSPRADAKGIPDWH